MKGAKLEEIHGGINHSDIMIVITTNMSQTVFIVFVVYTFCST